MVVARGVFSFVQQHSGGNKMEGFVALALFFEWVDSGRVEAIFLLPFFAD